MCNYPFFLLFVFSKGTQREKGEPSLPREHRKPALDESGVLRCSAVSQYKEFGHRQSGVKSLKTDAHLSGLHYIRSRSSRKSLIPPAEIRAKVPSPEVWGMTSKLLSAEIQWNCMELQFTMPLPQPQPYPPTIENILYKCGSYVGAGTCC